MAIASVRALLDGQWYTLAYNEASRQYEAEITPARTSYHESGGAFNVAVEAVNDTGTALTTDGTNIPGLLLRVVETKAPTLTLVSPLPGYVSSNRPEIVLEAADEAGGSGIDPGSFALTLDGAAASGFTVEAIANGYRLRYTPPALSEGPHTLTASAADYDGNGAETGAAYVVDTVPPALYLGRWRVVVDADAATVSGQTNDATAPPVAVRITNNGADTGAVNVSRDGHFSHTVPLTVGANDIAVTATDLAGLVTAQKLYAIRLVTDRTQGDVDALWALLARGMGKWTAAELAEFNRARSRGAYNFTDLNRVTLATGYLSAAMGASGYLVPLTAKNDWTERDIPAESDAAAYLADVETIRALLPLPPDAPNVPADVEGLWYHEANDIEKILVLVDGVYSMSPLSDWQAGEVFSGEV